MPLLITTGGPKARLAWAGARARRLWALKAKYNFTGGEGTGEGARCRCFRPATYYGEYPK
jgi:hypothetical protein